MDSETVMEFVVTHNKSHFVHEKLDRINLLFDVVVSFSSPRSSAESTGSQWIHLKGGKENNEKAKEYIMSLCDPDVDIVMSFPESVLAIIHQSLNKLEYDSGAVITVVSDREIRIRGSQMACAIASSAIEELKSRPTMDIDPVLKEFAIKLGYTEQDIQTVVKKHGPMVNENTLLHELIKISKTGQTSSPYTQSARNPNRHPIAEYEKYSVASKGIPSPAVPHHRGIVARGAPSSASTNGVRVMTVRGDKISYEHAVAPTPCNETSERPTLDKQEEQQVYQQLFEGKEDGRKNGDTSSELRHIVIDGSNVAMSHGNQETFSCFGIALCVNWFKQRGHKDITVFVPQWRKETPKPDFPMSDQEILLDLEKERIVVFTPSRRINGRRIVCYDDRFIVRLAADQDGIIVSNDNYRDLVNENPRWKEVIEQRLLMFSFVKDTFMVPDDPLGRHGPTLDNFLRKGTVALPRVCPYLGKCTFGLKCRFYHPERDPARKLESETVTSKTVLPKSHESKRKESLTDRTYRLHDRAVANGHDVRGDRTFKPSGVYDRQRTASYSDYYQQDFAGQSMYPINGVTHHQLVDPYYVPVRQMQPYPLSQSRIHECLNGNGVNTNSQSQAGNSPGRSHDVLDAPWDKEDQDLFQQLKAIYTQPEHEQVIRHVILNSQGKNLETLAADVADRVHGN